MSMRKLLESLDQIDENPLAAMAAGAVVDKLTDEEQIEESDVRKYTNKIHEAMDEGIMDPRDVADAALKYLSESDVEDMARINDWLYFFDEEDEDEDEEDDDWQSNPGGTWGLK